MGEKIEGVKDHLRRNQKTYIVGGVCLLAGFTCAVMRKNTGHWLYWTPSPDKAQVFSLLNFKGVNTVNVVNTIERQGRGHPGYIVRCLETGELFEAQKVAADVLGISEKNIGRQIAGKLEHANGYHFERVGIAN